MLVARYQLNKNEVHYGLLDEGKLRRLSGSPFESLKPSGHVDQISSSRLLCPLDKPRIFGAGLNYVSHVREMNLKQPVAPLLFMKPDTAAIGPDENIIYPKQAKEVHFEGEIGAVIGRRARHLSKADALGAVLGYTCANDLSERVIQRMEMGMGHLLIGKAFDTFCPIGPVIATGLDPTNLDLETRVNGEVRQSINSSDLLFSVAELVSYISAAVTLLPGDIILTGTPSGIGPVKPGDVVEVTVSGVGTLKNEVVAE